MRKTSHATGEPVKQNLVVTSLEQVIAEYSKQTADLVAATVAEILEGAPERPTLIKASTLAQRWECSTAHISRLKREGMPCVLCGTEARFNEAECVAWLKLRSAESAA